MSQAAFSLVAIARDDDGDDENAVHALCAREEPDGRRTPFVLNLHNSRDILDGTLRAYWRNEVAKAGIDPVFAIRAAQTLAHAINGLSAKALEALPYIGDAFDRNFRDVNMPYLRAPRISIPV